MWIGRWARAGAGAPRQGWAGAGRRGAPLSVRVGLGTVVSGGWVVAGGRLGLAGWGCQGSGLWPRGRRADWRVGGGRAPRDGGRRPAAAGLGGGGRGRCTARGRDGGGAGEG